MDNMETTAKYESIDNIKSIVQTRILKNMISWKGLKRRRKKLRKLKSLKIIYKCQNTPKGLYSNANIV